MSQSSASNGAHIPGRSLQCAARINGVTLFSGKQGSVTILPAPAGHGITFVRADADRPDEISATALHVVPESRRTVVGSSPADSVQTIEHLMSALAGLGVTDARIEVRGPELPIGDGSSEMFVEAILNAGVVETGRDVAPLVVPSLLRIEDGTASIVAEPRSEPGCQYTYELDYGPGSPILPQTATFVLTSDGGRAYAEQISAARTFSTLDEATAMRAMGLFAHLEPSQMLVIGPDGPIDNVLRFADEPARHKLLDLIGDLALVGRPIQASITARRTGHRHNHMMARALLDLA